MTESPQHQKEQVLLRINRKFIREFSKIGTRFTSGESIVGYIMPFAILRSDDYPMDAYSIIDLKDMPDEALTNLGLQKISAPPVIPQYRCFKEGEIIEEFDRYMNEDGELEAFHPNSIGESPVESFVDNPKFLKFVKTEINEEEL